jgi:sortilin (neurotensin receptor 3)
MDTTVTHSRFRHLKSQALTLLATVLLASPTVAQVQLDALSSMAARSIGPSGQGGRVTAIDAVVSNPDIIFVGAAAGGVWRSENAGTTWEPIFDDQPVQSIGAIAINQSNPDVIWVGTGEGNPRNSSSQGNGIYKSIDGGETWTHLGLENSRVIHRIVLHPRDADVAYLAVLGSPFGDSEERGVYRTHDGGSTWERVLYVDARTGAADLVMDPTNPNKLIAAMWSHRREPDFMTSGGDGSGLYVTYDGGENWAERTTDDGLPSGELGRIGLAIARSDGDIVYAIVEAESSVLLRSEDGARSFEVVNSDPGVSPRPFYYSDIYVDPTNENRLYRLSSPVDVSEDGGKTFETLVSGEFVHVDHHAWWIHPTDPTLILNGNDGGAAISRDRGHSWQVYHNLPVGQFYHVNVDMETPYNVYGGLQDNDSFRGPAYHWTRQGIQNYVWENLSCCADGFDIAPDPRDGRFGYSMYQGGTLLRYDRTTQQLRLVSPTSENDTPLRFNWNAALALDPMVPGRVYFGSQFVHQSDDDGATWTRISPDLTTNDPSRQRQSETGGLTIDDSGAENNTSITALGPSPVEVGVIWAGTDDGLVQVTRDGGASWTNVTKDLPDAPEGAWVPQVRPGYFQGGEAYVLLEDHRRDDWTPYVYHTSDYGESWDRVAQEVDGYALSIEQDPVEPNLVFLGTDRGLWVSFNRGADWQRWTHGVPATPVRDMVVHPREHDLVMATFGRSFLIIDDIRPLRAIAREGAEVLDRALEVYPVPEAFQAVMAWPPGAVFPGNFTYAGENRPTGARISYSIAGQGADESEEVTIEILQGATVVRRLTGPAKPGLNRATWGLERRGVRPPQQPNPDDSDDSDETEPGGPAVLPGSYTVRISHGADTVSTSVLVSPDPRVAFVRSEALVVNDAWEDLLAAQRSATEVADRIRDAQGALERVEDLLEAGDYAEADSLQAHGDRVGEQLDGFMERFTGPEGLQGFRNDPSLVTSKLRAAGFHLSSGLWSAPTQGAARELIGAQQAVDSLRAEVDAFFAVGGAWSAYRSAVDAVGLTIFPG